MKYLTLLFFVSAAASANVYKCEVNGTVSYSQLPCGDNASKTEYQITAADIPVTLTASTLPPVNETPEQTRERLSQKIKKRDLAAKIERYKRKKVTLANERDEKLAKLKNTKRQANNNLAGATWEESLSTEMEAIAKKYATDIQSVDNEIDRMIAEHDKL